MTQETTTHKAWIGGGLAAVSTALGVLAASTVADNALSLGEVLASASAGVAAGVAVLGTVYTVRNRPIE